LTLLENISACVDYADNDFANRTLLCAAGMKRA